MDWQFNQKMTEVIDIVKTFDAVKACMLQRIDNNTVIAVKLDNQDEYEYRVNELVVYNLFPAEVARKIKDGIESTFNIQLNSSYSGFLCSLMDNNYGEG